MSRAGSDGDAGGSSYGRNPTSGSGACLMMTGPLMSRCFDAVSVPAVRRLGFNPAVDTPFANHDAVTPIESLASGTLD